MIYNDEYFEDGIIDGFYVPSMMKKAWAAQLEVLEEISRVCERHNIRWWADCGTLLGAVRHGGYIPWDDDLDICMFRDDLRKFEEFSYELPKGYDVKTVRTHEDYDNSIITRVINKTTVYIDDTYMEKYHGFPFVAGVDIFALDYVSSDDVKEKDRLALARLVSSAEASINPLNENASETRELLAKIERLLNIRFADDKPIRWQLRILLQDIYSMFTNDPDSQYVVLMSYWRDFGDHKYRIEWFDETAYLPFENMMIPVPACFDCVLRTEYGNYMKICRNSGVHDYPFYLGMKKQLFELLEYSSPYEFRWKNADMQERPLSPVQKLNRFFEESDRYAGKLNAEAIVYLQQLAIEAGTALEASDAWSSIVSMLEEYCDRLYECYCLISSEEGRCESEKSLCELVSRIKSRAAFAGHRREVLFIVWKYEYWPSVEEIYRKAVLNSENDVYVICIPYYYRRADGSIKSRHSDEKLLSQVVQLTDRDEYNPESRLPAEIYINFPYDGKNDYVAIDECYYSENLRRFTERLVYVSPFVTDEIDDSNERAVYNMRFYAAMPAVVYADDVFVQSEKMRERYVSVLTEWSGEDTGNIWDGKIHATYSVRCMPALYEMPEEWREFLDGNGSRRKKILLFSFNISSFMENKEHIIGKLEKVLATCEKRREDINLWWFDDVNIERVFSEKYSNILAEYLRIKEQFISGRKGIYDNSGNYARAVSECDAYYGSPGVAAAKMNMAGKPVMIADMECDS